MFSAMACQSPAIRSRRGYLSEKLLCNVSLSQTVRAAHLGVLDVSYLVSRPRTFERADSVFCQHECELAKEDVTCPKRMPNSEAGNPRRLAMPQTGFWGTSVLRQVGYDRRKEGLLDSVSALPEWHHFANARAVPPRKVAAVA